MPVFREVLERLADGSPAYNKICCFNRSNIGTHYLRGELVMEDGLSAYPVALFQFFNGEANAQEYFLRLPEQEQLELLRESRRSNGDLHSLILKHKMRD